ncbi:MAG: DinB family protein [Terriglobia bacterium]
MAKNADQAVQTLVDLIDEAYDHTAWHGPNLKSALRGVTAEMAAWTPEQGRHSIREIVLHAAYWKHQVRRRLSKSNVPAFPARGYNWFSFQKGSGEWNERAWKSLRVLLEGQHRDLRQAVAGLSAVHLASPAGRKGQSVTDNVVGVALHDVYHAGQIQLLKRLMQGSKQS